MERQKAFDEYVAAFCQLELAKKRELITKDLIQTLAIVQKVAEDIDKNTSLLINSEILDAKQVDKCSEDDFYEALFVYIHSIQESLGVVLNKLGDDYYH